MSSFLCFVCHSTVNADTNEDTRDKYREVIGMNLCPDSHLCFICCYFLNKMWLFKSICLKRSLEYPVLFSEKGTINLQRSDTQVGILCSEDICLQHRNSKYHFYNNTENSPSDFEENKYVQLHEEMNFGLLPNNVEVQTDDLFAHFNDNLLRSDDVHFNNEFLVISKENDVNARRDVDEFIFGNDSIESPLENINKIELTNLEEMSEVNITLTDLNVRNFVETSKEFRHNDFVAKSHDFFLKTNNYVEKSQSEFVKSNHFVEKEYEVRNNDYVDKEGYRNNSFVEKQAMNNIFVEKTTVLNENVETLPELVRNTEFIERSQVFVVKSNDFDEKSPVARNKVAEKEVTRNNVAEVVDDIIPNDNDTQSNDSSIKNEDAFKDTISEVNPNEIETENVKIKRKKTYTKITLSLEEQKKDLEANRRSKRYTDAVFKCYNCAMGFLFKDSYQAHMMRHEESNGEHRCSLCTLRFANLAVLRLHLANHAVRYVCKYCEMLVKSKHRLTHACTAERNVKIACHLCGKIFPGASHYEQHLKRAHRKKSSRTYLCNVCGKSFDNQPAVRTHMITHINKKFPCEICGSIYRSLYTLNQHKKKHESKPTELHFCVTCNIGYNTRKSLLAHQRNALAHKERVYKCPVCDKTCPTVKALHNHTAAIHARAKDLYCALCPARYSTRKGLVRHMKDHNSVGPKQLPLCHACGDTFKSSSILKRHLKNVCEKDKLEEELSKYYEQ